MLKGESSEVFQVKSLLNSLVSDRNLLIQILRITKKDLSSLTAIESIILWLIFAVIINTKN